MLTSERLDERRLSEVKFVNERLQVGGFLKSPTSSNLRLKASKLGRIGWMAMKSAPYCRANE